MAQTSEKTAPAPAIEPAGDESFMHRELNGATFLTLEHAAHMALTVVLPLLLITSIMSALNMWAGLPGITDVMGVNGASALLGASGSKVLEAAMALGAVAALLVLAPALLVLDRRTRAEWHKRPGYAGRLAYKVPVYSALAVLGMLMVASFIEMIYVVITSLAFVGVANAPIGTMYLDTFLPAAIAFIVFAGAAWYVFNLAKGRDYGRKFSLAVAALGLIAVVSLFITSITILHNGENSFPTSTSSPTTTDPYSSGNSKYYQDFLNQLNQ